MYKYYTINSQKGTIKMKKILSIAVVSTLALFSLNSCTSDKSTEITPKGFENTRTVRTADGSNVTCNNCRAKFKISTRIQKLVNSGNAEVKCPVCHKNYLTGQVIKH